MTGPHPLPWRVEYHQRFPTWHEKSMPKVVDAWGNFIVAPLQRVGHPGEYDEEADQIAHQIVAGVNAHEAATA